MPSEIPHVAKPNITVLSWFTKVKIELHQINHVIELIRIVGCSMSEKFEMKKNTMKLWTTTKRQSTVVLTGFGEQQMDT